MDREGDKTQSCGNERCGIEVERLMLVGWNTTRIDVSGVKTGSAKRRATERQNAVKRTTNSGRYILEEFFPHLSTARPGTRRAY